MISTVSWGRLHRQAGRKGSDTELWRREQPQPGPVAAPLCQSRALDAARHIHKSQMKGQRLCGEGTVALNYPGSRTELLQAEDDFACQGRLEQWPQPVR